MSNIDVENLSLNEVLRRVGYNNAWRKRYGIAYTEEDEIELHKLKKSPHFPEVERILLSGAGAGIE